MSDALDGTAVLNPPSNAKADLSAQIEHAVQRDPADRVKCVRVFDEYYRCNWWSQPDGAVARDLSAWGTVATQRVRKSRFLNVTTVDGKLVIKEMPSQGA